MLKSSLWFPRVQWQIFQIQQLCIYTQCSARLACHWWYKLFVHWWMKGMYFVSFYFRIWDLTREIRENLYLYSNTFLNNSKSILKQIVWEIYKWQKISTGHAVLELLIIPIFCMFCSITQEPLGLLKFWCHVWVSLTICFEVIISFLENCW